MSFLGLRERESIFPRGLLSKKANLRRSSPDPFRSPVAYSGWICQSESAAPRYSFIAITAFRVSV